MKKQTFNVQGPKLGQTCHIYNATNPQHTGAQCNELALETAQQLLEAASSQTIVAESRMIRFLRQRDTNTGNGNFDRCMYPGEISEMETDTPNLVDPPKIFPLRKRR